MARQSARAAVLRRFGGADNLSIEPAPNLAPGCRDLMVRVKAGSINPIEWKMREGFGLPRPLWRCLLGRRPILGLDFSGVVVATGEDVRGYKVGDEVFGSRRLSGAYSERLLIRETGAVAVKPMNIPHAKAALVPFAGQVAMACLKSGPRKGRLEGARVMVIGGSGGVGHLAVQLARRVFDAGLVVGVCSGRNAEFVAECGAHAVVAYDQTPPEAIVAAHPEWMGSFDLIVDAVGHDRYFRALAPALLNAQGHYAAAALPVRGDDRPGEDASLSELPSLAARLVGRSLSGRYSLVTGLIGGLGGATDMARLAEWMADGRLRPHEHAAFELDQIARAHQLSETGRVVGKISLRMSGDGAAL